MQLSVLCEGMWYCVALGDCVKKKKTGFGDMREIRLNSETGGGVGENLRGGS